MDNDKDYIKTMWTITKKDIDAIEKDWIKIQDKLPLEKEVVFIYGYFYSHYEAIAKAYWEKCGYKDEKGDDYYRWYSPNRHPDDDWIAYMHEVRYWSPLKDFK